jgi:hypothetical protein
MADIMSSRKKAMNAAERLAAIHAKVPVIDTAALDAQVAAKAAVKDEGARFDRCVGWLSSLHGAAHTRRPTTQSGCGAAESC